MPLVVLCGLPGSGKTRRAEELRAALGSEGRRVFVVSERGEGGGEARSALRAETERLLSRRDVVVVDAGSELKSFRYELFCLSKQASTPHCVLLCPGGAPAPDRPPLEEPQPGSRWDRPLFVAPEEPGQALPLPEIRAALFQRRPPPPNASTRAQPLQPAAFLHSLDRLTQDAVAALVEAQRRGARPGEAVPLALGGAAPGPQGGWILPRPAALPELSRLRRQFLSYAKMHPGEGGGEGGEEAQLARLGSMFLQYLSQNLQ